MPTQTQKNQQNSAKELTKRFESIRNREGDQSAKEILSGARAAAAGIMDPYQAEETLRLYQQVEKNLFGELGELNPGEEDLTKQQTELASA